MNTAYCAILKSEKNCILQKTVIFIFCLINFCLVTGAYAFGPTYKEDAKKAILQYAEHQTREAVKTKSKAAITALYKRLYKSGANRSLSRKLTGIALAADEINQLAEAAADAFTANNPDKIQAATESLAIALGNRMSQLAQTSAGRRHLKNLMGKAGDIKEIAGMLGAAGTKHGNRAIAEYAGQVLINMTPAAGVVAFYKTSYVYVIVRNQTKSVKKR